MKKDIQSLINHETWILIFKDKIIACEYMLGDIWVYKIKGGVDNQVTWRKFKWVVEGYLQYIKVDID